MGFVPREIQALFQLIKHGTFNIFWSCILEIPWAEMYSHSLSWIFLESRISDVLFRSDFLCLKEYFKWKLKLWWSYHVDTVLLISSWQISVVSALQLETPVLMWVPNMRAVCYIHELILSTFASLHIVIWAKPSPEDHWSCVWCLMIRLCWDRQY